MFIELTVLKNGNDDHVIINKDDISCVRSNNDDSGCFVHLRCGNKILEVREKYEDVHNILIV